MPNIMDYLNWNGNIKINKNNINEIDLVIFAILSYLNLETIPEYPTNKKITLNEALNKLFQLNKKENINMGIIVPQQTVELAYKLKNLNRYQIKTSNYINIIDYDLHMQFSAICFHIDNIVIITYRGTDDSLIGWQENIDMISNFPINGEKKATEYLNEIAKIYTQSKIIVVGHSKGGTLATYASICCNDNIKNRITGSYDFEGPGFDGKFNETSYNIIKNKLHKYLSEESIIGMLLNEVCTDINIIKCNKFGLYQHDAFTWNVMKTNFVKTDKISDISIKINENITQMISKLNKEKRNEISKDFFKIIKNNDNMTTLTECKKNKLSLWKAIIKMKNKRFFIKLILNIYKYKRI